MNKEQYINQVTLLLDCLPTLKEQDVFALKGGTAINFFIQDLPRLSVDIDLTYVNSGSRDHDISKIEEGLVTIAKSILKRNKRYQVKELRTQDNKLKKLIVKDGLTKVKIEPNFIMRGTLASIVKMDISKAVEDKFEYNLKQVPILSEEELYAGKICAALSRQHPRDLFDIKKLFEKQDVTDEIRQAFVIYLICSPRPIHELLQPNLVVLKDVYENEFVNMTEEPVSLETLLETRETLINKIRNGLSDNEKNFILSIKQGQPDYELMPFKHLDNLPALKWKLINIQKMDKQKHIKMLHKLQTALNI